MIGIIIIGSFLLLGLAMIGGTLEVSRRVDFIHRQEEGAK
jgi:Ca2+/H+ antiporter